jgi:hypothetical protein
MMPSSSNEDDGEFVPRFGLGYEACKLSRSATSIRPAGARSRPGGRRHPKLAGEFAKVTRALGRDLHQRMHDGVSRRALRYEALRFQQALGRRPVAEGLAVGAEDRMIEHRQQAQSVQLGRQPSPFGLAGFGEERQRLWNLLGSARLRAGTSPALPREADRLEELDRKLSGLIAAHDAWQTFDDHLRFLKSARNLDLFTEQWAIVRTSSAPLYVDSNKNTRQLQRFGAEIDVAVTDQDWTRVRQSFSAYQSTAMYEFVEIDMKIVALLEELTQFAASLASQLLRDNLDENGGGNRSLKRRPVAKA